MRIGTPRTESRLCLEWARSSTATLRCAALVALTSTFNPTKIIYQRLQNLHRQECPCYQTQLLRNPVWMVAEQPGDEARPVAKK
jgi:hypothetical protein